MLHRVVIFVRGNIIHKDCNIISTLQGGGLKKSPRRPVKNSGGGADMGGGYVVRSVFYTKAFAHFGWGFAVGFAEHAGEIGGSGETDLVGDFAD